MKRNFVIGYFSTAVLLLSTSYAISGCRYSAYKFYFNNDEINVPVIINSNKFIDVTEVRDPRSCRHNFHSGGPSTFKDLTILSKPKNGIVTHGSISSIEYKPKIGFKGSDMYSIKICGETRGSPGCSKITYNLTIE